MGAGVADEGETMIIKGKFPSLNMISNGWKRHNWRKRFEKAIPPLTKAKRARLGRAMSCMWRCGASQSRSTPMAGCAGTATTGRKPNCSLGGW